MVLILFTEAKIFIMKIIKLLIVLLFAASYSFAQSPYLGGKAAFGITRLPNSEIKDNSDSMKLNLSFGYSAGIVGGIAFTERFKIQAEILLSNVNQKYQGTIPAGDYNSITETKMLDIPVMVIVGKWVYVEAGGIVNILLKANFSETLNDVKTIDKENVISKYDRINYGIAAGGGVNLNIGEHFGFNAGLRAYVGLNDFGKGVDALKNDIKTDKTTYWSLMLNAGLRIRF